ncbi:unnamed protein product [Symbiodinium pilosum]|uniref:Bacterial surface antigen (D15) domain-containing protein n=1 Tax=Symbiodinium pilosum TaxID=2952 RepID=A0A812IPE4_SYMPI|nr:unnamed protein product [Symbiodinium pilosum]
MAPRYVPANTPLDFVKVFIEGLQGEARASALRAEKRLRECPTLGKLNAELNAVADELGDGVVEVTPGPREGIVCVTLRPEHGGHVLARAGQEPLLSGSAFALKFDATPAAASGPPPLRVSTEGVWNLAQEGLGGYITAAPLIRSGAWSVLPSLELGYGLGGLLGFTGPAWQRSHLQACLADRLGRHKVRLGYASRDLRTEDAAMLGFPLQSSKTSISYQFLNSYGTETLGGQVGLFGEVAGLLGDVKVARAEASWSQRGALLAGIWQVSAGAALAKPLFDAQMPWEERLFLGGVTGQGVGERLFGFKPHGLGPLKREERSSEARRFGLAYGRGGLGTYSTAEPTRVETGKVDFLGGDTRASVEGWMRWPMPMGLGLYVFAFGAAGVLVERRQVSEPADILRNIRAALGLGIGVPLPGGGHLAVTYSQPVQAVAGDRVQAFQLSLSLNNLL